MSNNITHSTPWTPAEDARLAELWDRQFTCATIGAELGRTGEAVRSRVKWIGLERRLAGGQRAPRRVSRPSPDEVFARRIAGAGGGFSDAAVPPDYGRLRRVVYDPGLGASSLI